MADKIVQLIDEDGDNVFPVAAAQTADTATINDGAITTAKLANTSVNNTKIDWSTMGPQWFVMTTTNIAGDSLSFTSPRGHTYNANTVNAGSGFKVTGGANSIKKVKGHISFVLTGATANSSALSMHGVSSGTNVYARSTGGLNGGTVITPAQTSTAASATYAAVGISVGKITGGAFDYVAMRKAGTNNIWEFIITFHANGGASSVDYTVECTAYDNFTIPTPYCGGTGSLGSAAHCVLELLEES